MNGEDLKIGDTVYQTDGARVYELVIENIIFDTFGIAFNSSAIGESIFLTREAAEEHLAELTGKKYRTKKETET